MTSKRLLFIREFEQLYTENYSRLYYYAYTILEDVDLSKDIVSEVFSKVWDDFDLLDQTKVKGYLSVCVRNRCIDWIREQEKQKSYADYMQSATEMDESFAEEYEKNMTLIEKVMDGLSPQTQLVLERCYFNHKKYQEVADELGITVRMVKRHISKALSAFRMEFSVKNDEDTGLIS